MWEPGGWGHFRLRTTALEISVNIIRTTPLETRQCCPVSTARSKKCCALWPFQKYLNMNEFFFTLDFRAKGSAGLIQFAATVHVTRTTV